MQEMARGFSLFEEALLVSEAQDAKVPQIYRWHHPNDRKWRTKETLYEDKGEEWKGWLKTQPSKNKDHGIWSHHFMVNREKI